MTCQMCIERGQTWAGDQPKCAFLGPVFSPDNWNCATANAIRELVEEAQEAPPCGVDFQYCDDQKYATVKTSHMLFGDDDGDGGLGYALWVCWYKSRGRTDALWLLRSEGDPKQPSEAECRAIIAGYRGPSAVA